MTLYLKLLLWIVTLPEAAPLDYNTVPETAAVDYNTVPETAAVDYDTT
jgi:hypothetical protein